MKSLFWTTFTFIYKEQAQSKEKLRKIYENDQTFRSSLKSSLLIPLRNFKKLKEVKLFKLPEQFP